MGYSDLQLSRTASFLFIFGLLTNQGAPAGTNNEFLLAVSKLGLQKHFITSKSGGNVDKLASLIAFRFSSPCGLIHFP